MTGNAKGQFRAFVNSARKPGDDKPAFEGELTLPGDDTTRAFALWARKDKTGAVILSGRSNALTGSARDQIAQLADNVADGAAVTIGNGETALKLDPREIVLFENRKKADKQPDYYGWHHAGRADGPALSLAVWVKTDSSGRAYLKGSLEEPRVREHEAEEEAEHAA